MTSPLRFPVRKLGDVATAVIIVPLPESHLQEPWLNIQTGETTLNLSLSKHAVDALFLLAEDLQRALDSLRIQV